MVLFLVLISRFIIEYRRRDNIYQLDKDTVCLSGFVYHKDFKNDEFVYYLKSMKGFRVLIKGAFDVPLYSRASFEGDVRIFERARNEGGYDERAYYEGLGILCELEDAGVVMSSVSVLSVVGEALYHLSESVDYVYECALPGEESGVMSAIALGRRGGLDADVKDILSGAGIIHIIAVSGLHISVVGRGLYRLLRKKIGVGFIGAALIAFFVVLLYALMCGMTVSCFRAVGMFAIFLFAEILGRGYDMGRAAIVMAISVLIYNPFFLFSSSFIFSFGAVAGIVLVAEPVTKIAESLMKNKTSKIVKKWILSLISAASISLFTMPIVAWFYYEVPVYSVFLNILVLPVIGALLLIGLVAGVGLAGVQAMAMMVSGLSLASMGRVLLYPCHLIIYYIEFIADKSALLPGAKFSCGRPEWWSIVVYYAVMIGGVRLLKSVVNRGKGKSDRDNGWRGACWTLVVFVASLFLMLFSRSIVSDYRIAFLDVGQGDGIYLTDGCGCDIMIDGGSTSNKQLGRYTVLPFLKFNGVREVDYWFVSHCDEDHVSGLKYAASQGYRINGVYLANNVLKDEGYESLVAVLDEAGVPVFFMGAGDALVTDKFSLKCVFPDEVAATEIGNDANGRSMVLRLDDKYGHSGLFVGDMNEKAELEMVKRIEGRLKVDFLKVAHHGSRYSSTKEFLDMVRPRIAIISYGRNNYGHPHKDTLARLDEIGARVFGTKEMGQITLLLNRRGMVCEGYVE